MITKNSDSNKYWFLDKNNAGGSLIPLRAPLSNIIAKPGAFLRSAVDWLILGQPLVIISREGTFKGRPLSTRVIK